MYNIMSIIIILFAETTCGWCHLNYNQARVNCPGVNCPGVNRPGVNCPGVNCPGVNCPGVNRPGANCPPPNRTYEYDTSIIEGCNHVILLGF